MFLLEVASPSNCTLVCLRYVILLCYHCVCYVFTMAVAWLYIIYAYFVMSLMCFHFS